MIVLVVPNLYVIVGGQFNSFCTNDSVIESSLKIINKSLFSDVR